MNRDCGYYRRQRKRTICRKRRILLGIGGRENLFAWTHGVEGRLSKGKIHCSCPMCRIKSYDNPAIRDKRAAGKASDMVLEYCWNEELPRERDA